jgi:hypothetical protein
VVRGLRKTDFVHFGSNDKRQILCALNHFDDFLNNRFRNRYRSASLEAECKCGNGL